MIQTHVRFAPCTFIGTLLSTLVCVLPAALPAQSRPAQSTPLTARLAAAPASHPHAAAYVQPPASLQPSEPAPFSRFALGGGISSLGINLQGAVLAARHLNVRATGNFFNYEDSNISTNGFAADAKLNLATAGLALDYFPWARHGLRLSPGMLVHNANGLNATMTAMGGTSFTLNNVTYYSSPSDPVQGMASVGLHTEKVSPTATLGWGNMIPRNGHHFSFPVEVGAAYTGKPALAIALTSGQVCADPQGTVNCQNVVGNADVNSNLQAQVAKDQKNLSPLRFYPIVSFGMAYSFGKRPAVRQ